MLVVDDDESIRKVLTIALEEEGYIVNTAENGEEAIEKSNAEFCNFALIDIRLPDMVETKLLNAMKETTPKMIKIIITGYPSIENAMEAVNKSADAYILTPLNMDRVLNTTRENLQKNKKP